MTTEKKLHRIEFHHESVEERVKHFHEFKTPLTAEEIHEQALRCLHCGTPYCSSSCPLHNRPVDWNRLVREGKWRDAWEYLPGGDEPHLPVPLRSGLHAVPD